MTTAHIARLRSIMLVAWDFKRAEPTRAFRACLKASWKMAKQAAKAAARIMASAAGGRIVHFNSPIYSPSTNATRGSRYPGFADRQAGQMITRLGV